MNKDTFVKRKANLTEYVFCKINDSSISNQEKSTLRHLLQLLEQYTFENRLQTKGLLSHTIIDSMSLDYSIGEMFIQFDNGITK